MQTIFILIFGITVGYFFPDQIDTMVSFTMEKINDSLS